MIPHLNIQYIWTSPEGKTSSQINYILIDRRRHSIVLDTRSFREADCITDHYLAVTTFKERLAVSKQTTHGVHIEKFSLRELNEVESKEEYRVEILNRFAALENLDVEVDINRAWETVRENIKISAKGSLGCYKLKKHKIRLDEGF
jgi:hypothetical protein